MIASHLIAFFFNERPYHDVLMQTARAHIDKEGHVAIVVAFMACEIFMEQVISFAFKQRGIEDLEDPVTTLYSGSSLGNPRVRKLYLALTKDPIGDAPFWPKFREFAELRNSVVHSGKPVSRDDAQMVCDTAELVLAHLKTIMEKMRALPDPSPQP